MPIVQFQCNFSLTQATCSVHQEQFAGKLKQPAGN